MELCFAPCEAAKLLYLEYPAEEYLVAMRNQEMPGAKAKNPNYMYIVRHNNQVMRHQLENTEHLLLSHLFMGNAVGLVLTEITDKNPQLLPEIETKIQFWFARWIENGFFREIDS